MAHAELWKKTGGEWVDRKYIGGEFTEVDSVGFLMNVLTILFTLSMRDRAGSQIWLAIAFISTGEMQMMYLERKLKIWYLSR
jgi:hypothetical protein